MRVSRLVPFKKDNTAPAEYLGWAALAYALASKSPSTY
jgi:hypothetical protein